MTRREAVLLSGTPNPPTFSPLCFIETAFYCKLLRTRCCSVMPVKIIHTADLHLGAKLSFLGEKADTHRKQMLDTLQKIIDIAIKEKADMFLFAGDLFDSPFPSKQNISYVIKQIQKLMQAQIFTGLIPGNHDRLEAGSVYTSTEFSKLDPKYFKIFMSEKHEAWKISELDLSLHGAAVLTSKNKNSQFKNFIMDKSSKYNVALIHGSVDIKAVPDNYPVFIKDIKEKAFDYVALGDWHSTFQAVSGKTEAWYSGAPELLAVDQKEAGNILKIELGKTISIKQIKVGIRKLLQTSVDIGKYKNVSEIVDYLKKWKDPNTLLVVSIDGLKDLKFTGDVNEIVNLLLDEFFFVRIKDSSKLKLSKEELKKFPEELVTGRFIRILNDQKGQSTEMDELIDNAIQRGIKLLQPEI